MIKMLSVLEVPKINPEGEYEGYTQLNVKLEIDGFIVNIGGINSGLNKAEILQYLESRETELLAAAQQSNPSIVYRDELVSYTEESLPKSQHYALLTSISPSNPLFKAEVKRWVGEWFEGIKCAVSTWAVYAFQNNLINIGDKVVINYIPNPIGDGFIPFLVDKVEEEL